MQKMIMIQEAVANYFTDSYHSLVDHDNDSWIIYYKLSLSKIKLYTNLSSLYTNASTNKKHLWLIIQI